MPKEEIKPTKKAGTLFTWWRKSSNCLNGYSDFGDGLIVKDEEVYKYAMEHLRMLDRINPRKVANAVLISFDILCGALEEPKGKWYFF